MVACVPSSGASQLYHHCRHQQPHQSHLPPGVQALTARLFDVSRMCLASDIVSDDTGLSLSPCALHFKSVSRWSQGLLTRGGERQGKCREKERGRAEL